MKFEELNLSDNVLDALYDMRFEECTPIQEKCIPEILNGHDLLGVAQTGTGKTAAYLLPILSKLDDGSYPNDAVNCVIMSPTRELAQQIDQAMQGFSYYLSEVSSVAVYGGNDGNRYDQEMKGMKLGADIVIATPGRFISHINMGNIDLRKVSFFILDEADRMLDMGFSEDILSIARQLPSDVQTIMFSATMPDKIEELARTLLKKPVTVKLSVNKPADKIQQSAYVCYEQQKLGIVRDLFKAKDLRRVIVFCGKKTKVKEVHRALLKMGINAGEMHSDLAQAERDEMMFKFKSGQIDVLVATDILARGIDIDDIAMVINYDVPHDAEDYVHRIGRTARADKDGVAITMVNLDDIPYFKTIEKFLEKTVEKRDMPEGLGQGPDYTSGKGASASRQGTGRKEGARNRHSRPNARKNKPGNGSEGAERQHHRGDVPAAAGSKDASMAQTLADKPAGNGAQRRKKRHRNDSDGQSKARQEQPQNTQKAQGNRSSKPRKPKHRDDRGKRPYRTKASGEQRQPAKEAKSGWLKKIVRKPLAWMKRMTNK